MGLVRWEKAEGMELGSGCDNVGHCYLVCVWDLILRTG